MLLRLQIRGFKNLRDISVRLGPFTCFVGPNGVGKSNIFDAIQFLRHLADQDIQSAAGEIRPPATGVHEPLDLFWAKSESSMLEFEADMLTNQQVRDDFGVLATASTNLLRYHVKFTYEADPRPRLVLAHEELHHLRKGEAKSIIGFPHSRSFRDSALHGVRRGGPLISSTLDPDSGQVRVKLHQDGGSRGRAVPAGASPRTVLGGTNTADYPTILAAKREMSSWHSLHLEPSSLRAPDPFGAPEHVDERGQHIAATLHRLARDETEPGRLFATAANMLSGLVPEVREIRVREDDVHRQFVVEVRLSASDRWLGPRSLSDGTLRYLALVAMQLDDQASAVLCMEEPENGIHPSRVPKLIALLRDYAVDAELPIGEDNPMRQVILNSHSPDVVRQLDVDEVQFVTSGTGGSGRAATVAAVRSGSNWRGGETITLKHLEDLIGGSPVARSLRDRQLHLEFGSSLP